MCGRGHRISTGIVGTPLVCDALTATGQLETAYRLLLEKECPSWLCPVTQGASTIWERWDSLDARRQGQSGRDDVVQPPRARCRGGLAAPVREWPRTLGAGLPHDARQAVAGWRTDVGRDAPHQPVRRDLRLVGARRGEVRLRGGRPAWCLRAPRASDRGMGDAASDERKPSLQGPVRACPSRPVALSTGTLRSTGGGAELLLSFATKRPSRVRRWTVGSVVDDADVRSSSIATTYGQAPPGSAFRTPCPGTRSGRGGRPDLVPASRQAVAGWTAGSVMTVLLVSRSAAVHPRLSRAIAAR